MPEEQEEQEAPFLPIFHAIIDAVAAAAGAAPIIAMRAALVWEGWQG